MVVVELDVYSDTKVFVPHSPFTYKSVEGAHTTATYWTDTFGAVGDSDQSLRQINSVLIQPSIFFTKAESLTNCENTAQSFFFDEDSQVLYVHFPHDINPFLQSAEAGVSINGTNGDVVLIGGLQYNPIVRATPNVAQREDYLKYNTLSFSNGKITLANVNAQFDDIITSPIYGNEIRQYYLPNGKLDYTRSELVPIASYFVEDYDFTLSEFSINVQDKRKSGNANILSTKTIGYNDDIPLVYGQCRYLKCLPYNETETSGNITYTAGTFLSAIGTVQYWNDADKTWNTVTTVSTDLPNGRFVLSAANGREGGAASGTPRQIRLVEPTGITPSKPTDVIKDLNNKTLGVTFDTTYYDAAEWATEETVLSDIAIVFDRQQKLVDAIKTVQQGSYPGFRYEINAEGKRTIRINDWSRAVSKNISWYDIKDNYTLKVSTDSTNFAASVKVKYDKDFNSGDFLSVTNTTYEAGAFAKYRQKPQITVESWLPSSANATTMAEWYAVRLSEIRGIVEVQLHGQEYYNLRIYDILNIDLCTENRAYFSKWKCQVLSIAPDFAGLCNQISAILIERLVC